MESSLRKMFALIGIVILVFTWACSSGGDDDSPAPAGTEQASGSSSDPGGQSGDSGQSGGGGEGGGSGTPGGEGGPLVVPASFSFSLISNVTTTSPLVMSQEGTSPQRSVVLRNTSSQPLTGTLARSPEGDASGLAAPSSTQVTLNRNDVVAVTLRNFWGESARDLTITVVQPITFATGVPASGETLPQSGGYTVSYTTNTGRPESVTVVFGAPSENGGVSVRLNGSPALVMGPGAFGRLLDSTAPGWQQKAHVSAVVLEEVTDAVALCGRTASTAMASRDALESTLTAPGGIGFAAFTGDAVTPEGQSGPVTGSATLVWTDVNGDSTVDGGDSLQWRFNNDWENREGALVEDLTTGRADFAGFILNTAPSAGETVITETGFQVTDGSRPAVLFTDLRQTEVEETAPGVFTAEEDRVFVVNGGFDILFNG